MSKKLAVMTMAALLVTGCASVPMESKESSAKAKLFSPPPKGMAGLYIYRGGGVGSALKKNVLVDGICIGESAQHVFFYKQVAGNKEHTISTESEFSPNDLKLVTESNRNYFIEQYIKMGVFVGGANLKLVDEAEGKKELSKQELATQGACGK